MFLSFLFLSNFAVADSATASLKDLAVQASGRVKPYDTLAREALAAIYGKSSYERGKVSPDRKTSCRERVSSPV